MIEIERWIAARPETVFSYFTDPERFLDWQGQDASIDPHPGGSFRIGIGGSSCGVVRGEFLEVVAPRKVVFTWGWEGITSKPSTVEISLESQGEGTVLRLRHTYIERDDPQADLDGIEEAGGKTVVPVTEIPGLLTFAQFADPQGNVVGMVKAT